MLSTLLVNEVETFGLDDTIGSGSRETGHELFGLLVILRGAVLLFVFHVGFLGSARWSRARICQCKSTRGEEGTRRRYGNGEEKKGDALVSGGSSDQLVRPVSLVRLLVLDLQT
jgi:hypothetical protein